MIAIDSVISYLASLYNTDVEGENDLTNLKLQKLLYYCQGFCLAVTGEPLFENKIEAWKHGPVVPDVYHKYSQYSANPIPYGELSGKDIQVIKQDAVLVNVLDQVHEIYGGLSAWKLRNMTHEEKPWKDTIQNQEITNEILKSYFLSKVAD